MQSITWGRKSHSPPYILFLFAFLELPTIRRAAINNNEIDEIRTMVPEGVSVEIPR
jgi:hypothetical protein